MIPRDLSYTHPKAAFLLLFLILFFLLYYISEKKRTKNLSKMGDIKLLKQIALLENRHLLRLKFLFFCLFWFFVCLALMGPKGNEHYRSSGKMIGQIRPVEDVLFLIDTSQSMGVTDTKTKITRLENAKEIADQIARRLIANPLMLISFKSEPSLIMPLTPDNLFFRLQLKQLQLNSGEAPPGTNFEAFFASFKNLYAFDPRDSYQTLLIFSDGEEPTLEELSEKNREEIKNKILSELSPKDFPHLTIYAIGLGSEKGGIVPDVKYRGREVLSKLDPKLLETLAQKKGGAFYKANDYTPEDLAAIIVKKIHENEKKIAQLKSQTTHPGSLDVTYTDYFQIPLTLSLMALLIALILPETIKKNLFLLLFFLPSLGFTADDFLARQAYEAQNFSRAILIYQELLKTELPLETKRLIKYNLATSFLAEKRWDEGIEYLRDLSLDGLGVPNLLKMRSRYNLSYAFFHKTLEEREVFNQLYYLRSALFFAQQSCQGPCEFSYEVNEASLLFKKQINKLMQNLFSERKVFGQGVLLAYQLYVLHLNGDNKSGVQEEFNRFYSDVEEVLKTLIEAYVMQARDPFFEPFSIFYLKLLQGRALELFKENKTLKLAQEDLNQGLKQLEEGHEAVARLYLVEALLKVKSVLKLPPGPIAHLTSLIYSGEATVGLQRLFAANAKSLNNFMGRLAQSKTMVEGQSVLFPVETFKWQKKQFETGHCQCHPWDEAFPLFVQGLNSWKRAGKDAQERLDNYEDSLNLWNEALDLIKKKPEGQNRAGAPQEEAKNETLRELQEMQEMDQMRLPKKPIPTGGKPW